MFRSATADYSSAAEGLLERFGPSPNIEDIITEIHTRLKPSTVETRKTAWNASQNEDDLKFGQAMKFMTGSFSLTTDVG